MEVKRARKDTAQLRNAILREFKMNLRNSRGEQIEGGELTACTIVPFA